MECGRNTPFQQIIRQSKHARVEEAQPCGPGPQRGLQDSDIGRDPFNVVGHVHPVIPPGGQVLDCVKEHRPQA